MARVKIEGLLTVLLLGLVAGLVAMLVLTGRFDKGREPLRFNTYREPIFPDGGRYVSQYWPRTAGQLGEHIFSGHPQYPTAY